MRNVRLLSLALLVAMSLGMGAARAQEADPPVKDLGSNVYLVDGSRGPIPNLLPAEDVEKIRALQRGPLGASYQLVSPVSPDDQAVLAVLSDRLAFVNIQDGSLVNVTGSLPGPPISNFFWADERTLAFYTIRLSGSSPTPQAILATIDRRTGQARARGDARDILGRGDLPGLPMQVSPNGRAILFVEMPPPDEDDQEFTLAQRLPSGPEQTIDTQPALEAAYRSEIDALVASSPHARAIVGLAAAFDPLSPRILGLTEEATLRVYDRATGAVHEVAKLTPGAIVLDASFSQDGGRFAAVTSQIGYDEPPRGIYDGALFSEYTYRDATGNLPPNENGQFKNNTLVALDIASGAIRQLYAADLPHSGAGAAPIFGGTTWATDNQTLAVQMRYPSQPKGHRYPSYSFQYLKGSDFRLYNADMQEFRRIARIEISNVNARATFISPDELIITSHYRLDTHPYYYNWRSGEFRNIADRAGTYRTVVPTNQSRQIVFAYGSFTDPVDLYRVGWDGAAFARLTWTTEEQRQLSQTRQYPVSFKLRDGSTHTGVLLLPADVPFPPKRIPIVAWQEGGPTLAVENQWLALAESPFGLLPNFGFGMLIVPLYGRYGVGPERFEALAAGGNFGQVDVDAQAEIVQQIKARGWASKVGVVGCSYGGYFAVQSLIRHPGLYDAGHTMCTLVDAVTEWNRGFADLMPWLQGLPPTANLAEYERDSPLYNAGRIRTPLLAFHGTRDFLPSTVMQNFYLQVVNNKVPAKLLRFVNADHGFLRSTPPQLSQAYELYGAQEQILWFRTYLR